MSTSNTTETSQIKVNNKVLIKIDNGIGYLTLNRPEVRNAMSDDVILLLTEHLNSLQKDNSVHFVVLRGEGEHFCAGADVQWMQKSIQYSKEENLKDAKNLAKLLDLLYHFTKPTLCFVQGSVYGGALGLVAGCDIVIAEVQTKFCFSEVKLGLIPAVVGPYIIRNIGERAARYYMLTAEPFSSETALKLGLVNEVTSFSEFENKLQYYLNILRKNGPQSLRKTKQLINALVEEPKSKQSLMDYTATLIAEMRVTEEAQEGLKAFLEKRKPNWIDLS